MEQETKMPDMSKGALKASVAQNPVELGKTTMETMLKVIAGEQVEKNIPVPVELVTAGNA